MEQPYMEENSTEKQRDPIPTNEDLLGEISKIRKELKLLKDLKGMISPSTKSKSRPKAKRKTSKRKTVTRKPAKRRVSVKRKPAKRRVSVKRKPAKRRVSVKRKSSRRRK